MQAGVLEEQQILEEKLDRALDEASSKVAQAQDAIVKSSAEMEITIRLAAEAAEYSSALFSLTYNLEDVDPEVKVDRKAEPALLVRESVTLLRRARELQPRSAVEAYTYLRKAADYLKTAYLRHARKTAKKRS